MNLEAFTCRFCAETGRDDYDFCRNCVPLGHHCNNCVALGHCSRASFETPNLAVAGEMTLQRFDKNASQALGFVLVIVGMFPLIFGVLGSRTTCPPTGCSPDVISRLGWQNTILFFSGVALITIGIMSFLMARRVRPTHRTSATVPEVPAAE